MSQTLRIIRAEQFVTSKWKNGGGVTHEIATEENANGLIWRLSVAEVDMDGPFSSFNGLTRILTVIQGLGIKLHHSDGFVEALPLTPAQFSGELPVEGKCIAGPVRNLNLIYDAQQVLASVSQLQSKNERLSSAKGLDVNILFCVSGNVHVGGIILPVGGVALAGAQSETIKQSSDSILLNVKIRPKNN